MSSLSTFLFKSRYRLSLFGLVLGLIILWASWYFTEQLVSLFALQYVSGVVLLNVVLAYFAADRQPYLARFLIGISYLLIVLLGYNNVMIIRGLTL